MAEVAYFSSFLIYIVHTVKSARGVLLVLTGRGAIQVGFRRPAHGCQSRLEAVGD